MTAPRLLLLMGSETYRARDFLQAAARLGVDLVVGTDAAQPAGRLNPSAVVPLPFDDPDQATAQIQAVHGRGALRAVVSVDDSATVLAAMASQALGLPSNPVESAVSARDKHVFREILTSAGLPQPAFRLVPLSADPAQAAAGQTYPCVLKPRFLNASRGVIRADDPAGFVTAFRRTAALLSQEDVQEAGGRLAGDVLVESYLPGQEVALEGMVVDGAFRLLAFFDKPDPLEGPFFEETLFITPSRHPEDLQQAALTAADAAVRALGLRTGPVHVELRLTPEGPVVLELATRTIGGHCSRTLLFGTGLSLEEVVLRQALGLATEDLSREQRAAGVMMLPIPRGGILRGVEGRQAALAVPGIEDLEVSIPLSQRVLPLPEGHRYLGFLFARGEQPGMVEAALREAHGLLRFRIEPE